MQINNKPKHQHFIPRAYIKKFAQNGKFVDAVDIKTRMKSLVGIKDICVKRDLYTLYHSHKDNPYALENYYAQHVDSIYPNVYNLLVDKKLIMLSTGQKGRILNTLLT